VAQVRAGKSVFSVHSREHDFRQGVLSRIILLIILILCKYIVLIFHDQSLIIDAGYT
jgi:hypothetical protein